MIITRSRTNYFTPVLFFCILAALVMLFAPVLGQVITDYSHGELKHGTAALTVRQCIDQNGPLQVWQNPQSGSQARICELAPGLFGIQIIEKFQGKWQELTSFTKSKMNCIDQVTNLPQKCRIRTNKVRGNEYYRKTKCTG